MKKDKILRTCRCIISAFMAAALAVGLTFPLDSGMLDNNNLQPVISAEAATVYKVSWPVKNAKITSKFGKRTLNGKQSEHTGIDLVPTKGDYNIYAAESGKVIETKNGVTKTKTMSLGYGNYIKIQMSDGRVAIYGHLKNNTISVKKNQNVTAGTKIAVMGESGAAWGRHLHFEMRPKKYANKYGMEYAINVNPTSSGGSVEYSSSPDSDTNSETDTENVLKDNTTYRIKNGSYYIGTASNKTASKTNVVLVNKNDSSSCWVAHYDKTTKAWYFLMKDNQKMSLNPFADSVQSGTNVNIYQFYKNDKSQQFIPQKNSNGSFVLLNAQNSSVCLEVQGYAKNAKKGTNIRVYTDCGDSTQNWTLEEVK